jgi:hypothetical protein
MLFALNTDMKCEMSVTYVTFSLTVVGVQVNLLFVVPIFFAQS